LNDLGSKFCDQFGDAFAQFCVEEIQCSPKILLANLIANIPDVLELNCGSGRDKANSVERIKARIIKEKEILEGEKSP